jgi:tetratricopeptide (TPR) repeat protein
LDELEVRMKEQNRGGDLSDDMRRQFVGFCINLGQPELAEPWLNEFIANNASNMQALALKAQWMHAMHQDMEIDDLVEPAAKSALEQLTDDRQRAALCYTVGRIYTATEMYSEALPWHERLFDLAPEGYAPLAVNLARLGRTSEMLRVCEKAIPSVGLDKVAAKLAEALSGVPRLSEMSLHSGDDLVDQALRAHPKEQPLLMTSAALRARQQEIEEAAELYERVLDQDPRNIIALNNQATLLAEMPGTGDHLSKAIQRIDKAILYEGVQAGLLDTRGVTLIMRAERERGKAAFWYAEAVAVLRQACWSDKADARHFFHLAIALESANQRPESEQALQTALKNGLEDMLLTPDDLRQLARLKKEMNVTATSEQDSAIGHRKAAGKSTQPATMR